MKRMIIASAVLVLSVSACSSGHSHAAKTADATTAAPSPASILSKLPECHSITDNGLDAFGDRWGSCEIPFDGTTESVVVYTNSDTETVLTNISDNSSDSSHIAVSGDGFLLVLTGVGTSFSLTPEMLAAQVDGQTR